MANDPAADPVVGEALARAEGGDVSGATTLLASEPDPMAAMTRFGATAIQLYRQRRAIGPMLEIGAAGVRFGLAAARSADPDAAAQLRLATLRLGYNVAANSWPGWGDEGANPSRAEIDRGLAMAEESLALRRTLEPQGAKMGLGHWLVGALLWAAGRKAEAVAAFEAAERANTADGAEAAALLARGYQVLAGEDRAAGERTLADVVQSLASCGAADAPFLIEQLKTADRIMNAR